MNQRVSHIKSQMLGKRCSSILICLFLTGGMILVSHTVSQAQSLQSKEALDQTTNWLAESTAIQVLVSQITLLQAQLPNLTPDTPPYYDSVRRQSYYKAIINALQDGKDIPTALGQALNAGASLGGEKEVAFTYKATLRSLYEETRSLLSY